MANRRLAAFDRDGNEVALGSWLSKPYNNAEWRLNGISHRTGYAHRPIIAVSNGSGSHEFFADVFGLTVKWVNEK